MLLFFVVDYVIDTPPSSPSDSIRWNLIQRRAQEWRLTRAFRIFREGGIEPILIKGWAAGIHYPPTHCRNSIDMDLAVSSSDFAKAEDIAQAAAGEGLAIDLHRELRHLDTVDWADLYSNSITIDVEGYPIRVLRPEDHLRVICVHWLTDGGLNRERLWDIYYLVDNNRANFDWERFLGTVCKDRKRWLVCTLGLADRYLGLDLFGTPVQEDAKDLPAWFIRCVEKNWISGVKHVPLEVALFRPSELLRQLESRIRPNPISSTIEMNGSFDAKIRLHYRVGSFMKRVVPSLRRIRAITRQRPK